MRKDGLRTARLIALLVPVALLGGALGSQFIGHLVPCEMCMWQRWPHLAAIIVALLAFVVRPRPVTMIFVIVAGLLIALSGAIGVFHAGVEYHWWHGITACASDLKPGNPMDILNQALKKPLVLCEIPQWTFHGISLAGFNAIFSLLGAVTIFVFATKRSRR